VKITAIHEASVPICSGIRNAVISFAEMTVSTVAVVTDVIRDGAPVIGFGFNSNGRYAQSGILQQRLIPRLLRAPAEALLSVDPVESIDPLKAWQVVMCNEKPGGHGERSAAVGALDMALWDLHAKIARKPLYRLLADRFRDGHADSHVHVYAAGGYYYSYSGKALVELGDEMRRYVDQGHTAVKMKIGGAPLKTDLERIESVLKIIGRSGSLAVDANGRFDLPTALEYAHALAPYGLTWYEEPGDPLDYQLNAAVAQASATPIATGENLFSLQDARNLIRYGGMVPQRDYLQFDPALSYGLVEYLRILSMLRGSGWSAQRCIPHGGHQFAVHIAAGLGLGGSETYPSIFGPFGGFADGTEIVNGRIRPTEVPGIGFEAKQDLIEVFRSILK
jgi:L-alanine-DL-glutamate epimerase-like enolase superfamily enzyme